MFSAILMLHQHVVYFWKSGVTNAAVAPKKSCGMHSVGWYAKQGNSLLCSFAGGCVLNKAIAN